MNGPPQRVESFPTSVITGVRRCGMSFKPTGQFDTLGVDTTDRPPESPITASVHLASIPGAETAGRHLMRRGGFDRLVLRCSFCALKTLSQVDGQSCFCLRPRRRHESRWKQDRGRRQQRARIPYFGGLTGDDRKFTGAARPW